MKKYAFKAMEFLTEVQPAVYQAMKGDKFETELNYNPLTVEVLDDDHKTIWVKWGSKYDCKFLDLPINAMAAVADAVIEQ